MPEPDAPAVPAADNEPDAPVDNPNGEGTTPEEVASVLKSAGINLPENKPAPEAAVDDEEGEDPDKPVVDEEEPAEAEEEPAEEEEPAKEPAKQVEPVAADDDKYSFQIEDANGVAFKISVGAKMEDILAEFEPKNNGQILDILEQLREVKDQKTADDAQAEQDSAAAARTEQTQQYLKGWSEEAEALQGAKRIPEGKDGETRIGEVYKFMADENDARIKANKPTLNSFEDALDKLENKEARDAKVEQDKQDKETARKNGGKVGGASAPASSGTPVYKAGSAKNANQAIRTLGLLE
jgi:hypothetical protein